MSEHKHAYVFMIPAPSAKRLKKNVSFLIENLGPFGTVSREIEIDPDRDCLVWETDEELEHREPEKLDADYKLKFTISFANSTYSRREDYTVFPVDLPKNTNYQVIKDV